MNDENTINNDEIIQELEEIKKGLWAMAQEAAPRDDVRALVLTLYKVKIEEIQNLLQTHPHTCSQCKFCHQIEDYVEGDRRTPRWVCFATPPVWDGQFDPGRLTSWNQPQVYPNMPSCRFFSRKVPMAHGDIREIQK